LLPSLFGAADDVFLVLTANGPALLPAMPKILSDSIVSVSDEISQVLEAVLSPEYDRTRIGYNHQEDRLVSRLLSLLSPGLRRQDPLSRRQDPLSRRQKDNPLIEVVEEGEGADLHAAPPHPGLTDHSYISDKPL